MSDTDGVDGTTTGTDNKFVGVINDVSEGNMSDTGVDETGTAKAVEDTISVPSIVNKVVGLIADVSKGDTSEDTLDTRVCCELVTDKEYKTVGVT